jgi:hypothetical protein
MRAHMAELIPQIQSWLNTYDPPPPPLMGKQTRSADGVGVSISERRTLAYQGNLRALGLNHAPGGS